MSAFVRRFEFKCRETTPLIVVPRPKFVFKPSKLGPRRTRTNPAEPHMPVSLRPPPPPTRQLPISQSPKANRPPRLNLPSTHRSDQSSAPRGGLLPCSSRCIASKVSRGGTKVSERRSSKQYCAKVGPACDYGVRSSIKHPLRCLPDHIPPSCTFPLCVVLMLKSHRYPVCVQGEV
jgi:hypothetical protein